MFIWNSSMYWRTNLQHVYCKEIGKQAFQFTEFLYNFYLVLCNSHIFFFFRFWVARGQSVEENINYSARIGKVKINFFLFIFIYVWESLLTVNSPYSLFKVLTIVSWSKVWYHQEEKEIINLPLSLASLLPLSLSLSLSSIC